MNPVEFLQNEISMYKEQCRSENSLSNSVKKLVEFMKEPRTVSSNVVRRQLMTVYSRIWGIWSDACFQTVQDPECEESFSFMLDFINRSDFSSLLIISDKKTDIELRLKFVSILLVLLAMLKGKSTSTSQTVNIIDRFVKNRYELASFLVHHDDFLVTITYSLLRIQSTAENLRPIPIIISAIHQLHYQADFFFDLIMTSEIGIIWLKKFLEQLNSENYDFIKSVTVEASLQCTDVMTTRLGQEVDYPKPYPMSVTIKARKSEEKIILGGLKDTHVVPPEKVKTDPKAFFSFMKDLHSKFSDSLEPISTTKNIYKLFDIWFFRQNK